MAFETILKNKDLQKELAGEVNEMMLRRLRDIDGLDEVSWWPLAPGWWIIIGIIAMFFGYKIYSYFKRRAWRLSWQGNICDELDMMKQELNKENAHATAVKLADILKRIAMHKYSRDECASLEGKDWLLWLSEHDKKFNWLEKGEIIIKEVYAPSTNKVSIEGLTNLLKATRNWIL